MENNENNSQVDADHLQEIYASMCEALQEIEAEHRRRMSEHYKRSSKTMFVCAILLLIAIIAITLAWLRSTPKYPVFRFCIALFDFAIMIFDLHQSRKYARLADAYANERGVAE